MTLISEAGPTLQRPLARQGSGRDARSSAFIDVAFVSMMPGSRSGKTGQQFAELLGPSLGGKAVRWGTYSLAQQPGRVPWDGLGRLTLDPPDAIVMTGAEPSAQALTDEPFWQDLVTLLDWACQRGIPILLSCLAAHAALWHLEGVSRRRLPNKRFGVFEHVWTAGGANTVGVAPGVRVAHSRWNEVSRADLLRAGCTVLTESAEAGVDMFTKNSLLFCQGHPEYEPSTLLREYRRDIARYLCGDQPGYPAPPEGYLDSAGLDAATVFRELAEKTRDAALIAQFPFADLLARVDNGWHLGASSIVRRWLAEAAGSAK